MTWGLHLGGGTALGAYQVPILLQLISELGPPGYVVGVSVGSLNGAFVGMRRWAQLPSVWHLVGEQGTSWFQRLNDDPWNGFFTLKPLRKHLKEFQVGNFLIPTYAGLVNLEEGDYQTACLNGLPIIESHNGLIVSCTQPGIHERARFRGQWCVDGGVDFVLPLIPEQEAPSRVIVISCSPLTRESRKIKQTAEKLNSAKEQASAAFRRLMTNTLLLNLHTLEEQGRQRGVQRIDFYGPETWAHVGNPFDADRKDINLRLDSGEADAQRGPRLSFSF